MSLVDATGYPSLGVEEAGVVRLYRGFRRRLMLHGLAFLFPNTIFALALAYYLRRPHPCCVWGWMFLANVVVAPAARLAGVPRIVIRIENLSAWKTWPPHKHWWNRQADRNAARLADMIVVNASPLVEDYARWAGADRDKIVVLPNGIDVDDWLARPWQDVRPELGIGADEVVVLTVGRLAREKNQELLLQASALVHRRGVRHRLLVVGDGELEPYLKRRAQELGASPWVHFLSPRPTPQDFYRSADLFVLSSDIEGLPNALLESQAFALPAVTTAAGGAAEVVVDRETGFVVPCGAVEELATALGRLLEDRELRRQMGRTGQERVRREFALDRWVRRMEEISVPENGTARAPVGEE